MIQTPPRPTTHRSRGSQPANALPMAFGVIDTSVAVAYLAGVSPEIWHVATLATKIALLLYFGFGRNAKTPSLHFILLCSVALFASSIVGRAELNPLLSAAGFIAHLSITASVVSRDKLSEYLRAAGVSIALAATAHIILSAAGKVPNFYGRYAYLGGSSPSLGAEINAAGALALSLSARRKLFWPLISVLIVSTFLCQGRAASLAIAALCAVYAAPSKISAQKLLLGIIAFSAILLFGVLNIERASGTLGRLLLLNDQYRGVTTGFTGRDARWQAALSAFEAHPFLGAGVSRLDESGFLTPHNFFLYAISRHGIFGVAILVSIAYMYIGIVKKDLRASAFFLCITPLLIFNDRFMNTNPYPFILFVILLAFSPSAKGQHRFAPTSSLLNHRMVR